MLRRAYQCAGGEGRGGGGGFSDSTRLCRAAACCSAEPSPTVTPCDVMHCSLADRSLSRGHSVPRGYMFHSCMYHAQVEAQSRTASQVNHLQKRHLCNCTDRAYASLFFRPPKAVICCYKDTAANACCVSSEPFLREDRNSCVAAGAVRPDGQHLAGQSARPDSVQPAPFRWRRRPEPPPLRGNPRRRARRPGWLSRSLSALGASSKRGSRSWCAPPRAPWLWTCACSCAPCVAAQ